MTGSIVKEIKLTKPAGTVNLGYELLQGVYFVKISDGNNFSDTKRIVKL